MDALQEQVKGYFETLGFTFLEESAGFLVPDKLDYGGGRDTRLVWILPEIDEKENVRSFERRLINEFREKNARYSNARGWVVSNTFGDFSQEFRSIAEQYNTLLRVPIQFFDTAFKYEETPYYQSAIKELRIAPPRIPQPYKLWMNGHSQDGGDDLLETLWNDFKYVEKPILRIVVGPAGIGKTWLFKSLFSRLYSYFLNQKNKQESFPRPMPLIPPYLKGAGILRTKELIRSFVESEMASPVGLSTFDWLITEGYSSWLFDGLDELYSEDADFFHNLADVLTRRNSRSNILVCARESLLTTCEPFIEFINDYIDYSDDSLIRVYHLDGWEQPSKRAFANLHFDPPADAEFINYISRTPSLRELSKLPYYCDLLRQSFKEGDSKEFTDDFSLLHYAIAEITEREKSKNVWKPEDFLANGLNDWLEAVASDFYISGFKGVSRLNIETYAGLVLSEDLSEREKQDVIISLVQFPLFAPGIEAGDITFQHELVAEYLAGRYWFGRLINNPCRAATQLGDRVDFSDLLITRYMAIQLSKNPVYVQKIVNALKLTPPDGRAFTNLLTLILMASPDRNLLVPLKDTFEGRDLGYVVFENRNLRGFSFRNCNLTDTTFRICDLQDTKFECARIAGTRFEKLEKTAFNDAQFGDLGTVKE